MRETAGSLKRDLIIKLNWLCIKRLASRSAVFLEGEKSAVFRLEQGVVQGCSLSPILFSVFINDLLKVVSLGYS